MKAYIVNDSFNGQEDIDGVYYLITDDGRCWYSHLCSHKGHAFGDLYGNRPERKEELSSVYNEVEVLYLGEDDMTIDTLLAKNYEWYKAH